MGSPDRWNVLSVTTGPAWGVGAGIARREPLVPGCADACARPTAVARSLESESRMGMVEFHYPDVPPRAGHLRDGPGALPDFNACKRSGGELGTLGLCARPRRHILRQRRITATQRADAGVDGARDLDLRAMGVVGRQASR